MYDPDTKQWRVTLGFVPRWDGQNAADVSLGLRPLCIYRVVINDSDGSVVALTDRLLPASAACCKPQRITRVMLAVLEEILTKRGAIRESQN